MAISSSSSAAQIMSTVRSQFQQQFATLKAAYEKNGTIAGVETAYASADGNLKISMTGESRGDGGDVVDIRYSFAGQEGSTVAAALYDDPEAAAISKEFGGNLGSGSAGYIMDSADDFDRFAQSMPDIIFAPQEMAPVADGKTFASLAELHAYLRVDQAASDAVNAMADTMTFASDQERTDFLVNTQHALADALRSGRTDLSEILKGVPDAAIKAALQALDGKTPEAGKLADMIGDTVAKARSKSLLGQLDLLV